MEKNGRYSVKQHEGEITEIKVGDRTYQSIDDVPDDDRAAIEELMAATLAAEDEDEEEEEEFEDDGGERPQAVGDDGDFRPRDDLSGPGRADGINPAKVVMVVFGVVGPLLLAIAGFGAYLSFQSMKKDPIGPGARIETGFADRWLWQLIVGFLGLVFSLIASGIRSMFQRPAGQSD